MVAYGLVTVLLAQIVAGGGISITLTGCASIASPVILIPLVAAFGSENRLKWHRNWCLLAIAAGFGVAASGLSVGAGAGYMIMGGLPAVNYYHARVKRSNAGLN
jgi:hypothetical protein